MTRLLKTCTKVQVADGSSAWYANHINRIVKEQNRGKVAEVARCDGFRELPAVDGPVEQAFDNSDACTRWVVYRAFLFYSSAFDGTQHHSVGRFGGVSYRFRISEREREDFRGMSIQVCSRSRRGVQQRSFFEDDK
jgi:hypothetical protein